MGLFWNILPHLCYRIVPYWFVHSETERYLGFVSQNAIVLTHVFILYYRLYWWTTLRPLVRYVLWGRCTAFLTHIYYGNNFILGISLGNFVLGFIICACRTALRSSACWHLMGRLTAFGLYYLIGRFAAFWSIYYEIFILGVCLENFHFGSYLCLMGRFATFCLLALDGPPRGLRPTVILLAALRPLPLIWIDWPSFGLVGPNMVWFTSLRFWPVFFGWPLCGHYPKCLVGPLCGHWPKYGLISLFCAFGLF